MWLSRLRIRLVSIRVQSLALFGGLRIWQRPELWGRSQTWLRSGVAVAVAVAAAASCSSDSTPSLGTSICCRCGPKRKKNFFGRLENTAFKFFSGQNALLFSLALLGVFASIPPRLAPRRTHERGRAPLGAAHSTGRAGGRLQAVCDSDTQRELEKDTPSPF